MSKSSHMQSQKPQVLAMLRYTDILIERITRFLVSVIKLEALEEFLFFTEKMRIIFHKIRMSVMLLRSSALPNFIPLKIRMPSILNTVQ